MKKASKLLLVVVAVAAAEFLICGTFLAVIEYLYIAKTGKQMISFIGLPAAYIESFIAGGATGAVHGILTGLALGTKNRASNIKSGFAGWLAGIFLILTVFFYYDRSLLVFGSAAVVPGGNDTRIEKLILLVLLLFLIYPLGASLGIFAGKIRNLVIPPD